MGKKRNDLCPVMWRSTHEASKKRWKSWLFLTHLAYLLVLVTFGWSGWSLWRDLETKNSITLQKQEPQEFHKKAFEELKTKETIYSILRSKGVSLGQGLDIAEVTIQQSKKLDLPISLILAIMRKESTFSPFALSSQNAMGLMQIHPVTWEWYVKRLDLKVSVHAAFDPATNIIMATHILKDLYNHYSAADKSESVIWESALSAYYTGLNSLSQTGITESHIRYVADVNKFKKEFDEKFED